jgi:hypothetical protein
MLFYDVPEPVDRSLARPNRGFGGTERREGGGPVQSGMVSASARSQARAKGRSVSPCGATAAASPAFSAPPHGSQA